MANGSSAAWSVRGDERAAGFLMQSPASLQDGRAAKFCGPSAADAAVITAAVAVVIRTSIVSAIFYMLPTYSGRTNFSNPSRQRPQPARCPIPYLDCPISSWPDPSKTDRFPSNSLAILHIHHLGAPTSPPEPPQNWTLIPHGPARWAGRIGCAGLRCASCCQRARENVSSVSE